MYNILNFTIMFFQAINQMITTGTDLSINIRRVNDNLTVAVVPRRSGVKAGERIVPLILNGTPEELDAGFLQAVGAPVQKAQGILTNLESFEKQAEQAVSQSKTSKPTVEKESKEAREKREKMEKLLKKAEDATAGKHYSEALTWLRQAKVLAQPDKQTDIDKKMAEVQKKASEGSLFDMVQPPVTAPQPSLQQSAPQLMAAPTPQYRSGEQVPMFMPEQPAPQPVPQQAAPQPQDIQFHQPVQVPQPQLADNRWIQQPAPSQYATVQEAAMYNFDKDYEDDRELLREDPYAEYPDFPKECRMTDMAQMDMVYC